MKIFGPTFRRRRGCGRCKWRLTCRLSIEVGLDQGVHTIWRCQGQCHYDPVVRRVVASSVSHSRRVADHRFIYFSLSFCIFNYSWKPSAGRFPLHQMVRVQVYQWPLKIKTHTIKPSKQLFLAEAECALMTALQIHISLRTSGLAPSSRSRMTSCFLRSASYVYRHFMDKHKVSRNLSPLDIPHKSNAENRWRQEPARISRAISGDWSHCDYSPSWEQWPRWAPTLGGGS